MLSFDITCEVDRNGVKNATNQEHKMLPTRFDFECDMARVTGRKRDDLPGVMSQVRGLELLVAFPLASFRQ